ncbi:MAG: methyltransferase domain-containing protein [Archangiaceae bacterium]|nr:methyltransferase domain-containing protein [Archangiaceae bacterium]
MSLDTLERADFVWLTALFEARTGIRLGFEKHTMVVGRLLPRVRARKLESLGEYLQLLRAPHEEAERELLVDQLTTHETSFFREPKHFEVLDAWARSVKPSGAPLRIWSAACSSGEEAATIAMVLEQVAPPGGYEVVGTDVAPEVVRRAQRCVYPLERTTGLSQALLQRFCLRGEGEARGTFCLKDSLAKRLSFRVGNLLEPQPALGQFDVVFLRNVLIYFDDERRRRIVANVLERLKPGGLLLPGHAEVVRDCSDALEPLGPAAFRFVPAASRAA